MTKKELMVIRPVEASDLPFIYRSWLMGAYHGNRPKPGVKEQPGASLDYIGSIHQDDFMKSYHKYIEFLLGKASTQIACLKSDPDVILGYSVSEPGVLHWVFVKPDWRRIGICNDLLPKDIHTVTGFSRVGDVVRRHKSLKFNPFS